MTVSSKLVAKSAISLIVAWALLSLVADAFGFQIQCRWSFYWATATLFLLLYPNPKTWRQGGNNAQ